MPQTDSQRLWYLRNREALKARSNERYHRLKGDPDFIEKRSANNKKWFENNRSKHNAKEAKRRAKKLNATPEWLTQDMLDEIEYKYFLARDLSQITGEPHHVDHIVPLQGVDICGLHVPWNLQVLTARDNLSKSNKLGEV